MSCRRCALSSSSWLLIEDQHCLARGGRKNKIMWSTNLIGDELDMAELKHSSTLAQLVEAKHTV